MNPRNHVCYMSRNYRTIDSAGNKAKTDIEQVMHRIGFRNVGLPQGYYHSMVAAFVYTLSSVLKGLCCLRRGDILILQYPFKKYYSFVCNIAHIRGCRVVTLIHDLGSFRRKKLTVTQEIRRLNHSDYIIAHNERMKTWLETHGCKAQLGTLELFDYLSDAVAPQNTENLTPGQVYHIVYAGSLNLRKNAFLYEVGRYAGSLCRFILYGNGFDISCAVGKECIECNGFVSSDKLISGGVEKIGEFGLVWDGASVDSCSGEFGEYLRYNNPHKTSLYIRCHLPVIIWSQAALADFVREQGIGLCLDSLADLPTALATLTPQQYAGMKQRVVAMSNKLARGYFSERSLHIAIQALYPRA